MLSTEPNQLTPREFAILESETEEQRLAREHAVTIKKLELEVSRENNAAEIKLKELSTKWRTWLKLPLLIILLPFLCLLGVAYICSMFTRKEMPKRFWEIFS